jgi:uncharacterized OsmC-like protein
MGWTFSIFHLASRERWAGFYIGKGRGAALFVTPLSRRERERLVGGGAIIQFGPTLGVKSMDTEQLKAMQAPLKQQYREQPQAAQVTLKARGRAGEGITCKLETGRALAEAGLHPATGGDGLSLCSGDMLLEALVACAGVTLSAVATAIGVELRDALVSAEGDLDFRGTLAVSKDAPVGFTAIRLNFELDSDAPQEQLDSLLKLTERYCVVYQTLIHSPRFAVALQRRINRGNCE